MGNRRVQAVEKTSILKKRFRKITPSNFRLSDDTRGQVPDVVVLADLRNGVLESLDRYLRINRGIPDRIVAIELRKLISGSPQRSSYRLIAIEHPDGPPPRLGRKKTKTDGKPTERQWELAAAVREQLLVNGSIESAVSAVAETKGVSITSVYRARAACKKYENKRAREEKSRLENSKRREDAWAKLRANHPST